MNKLIAIVGLPGSGKSEAVNFFEENGFTKVYFGGLTMEELRKEGLEVNEKNERMMREKLRRDHGMAAYAKLNLPKIRDALSSSKVVIDGLYSWEEYKLLREELPEMKIISILAPSSLRYSRLSMRPVRPLTIQEAQSRDFSQIENINQAGPIVMADYFVVNDGKLDDLRKELKNIIKE